MNDTDALVIGEYLDGALQHPLFKLAIEHFEKTYAQAILDTDVGNAKEREEIYLVFNGAKQFLYYLMTIVKQKNDVMAKQIEEHRALEEHLIFNPNPLSEPIEIDGILC